MNPRSDIYFALSSTLALMDDRALVQRLEQTKPSTGWGGNRTLKIGETTVFTKSIPLTALEYERAYCTQNLYELPTFYNYGVGSAGFGAFRELASHVKTTNWVLSGACKNFPLMYHHRILPAVNPAQKMTTERLDGYVKYWDGNQQIRRYIEARLTAQYEVVIFLEHIPHTLNRWLGDNLNKLEMVMSGMEQTLTFLCDQGVIHFDAHSANILTDGEQVFLTDYGLVLDQDFDLSPEERAFFDAHRHYDFGEFPTGLLGPLQAQQEAWDDATRAAVARRYGDSSLSTLLQQLEALITTGQLTLPDTLRDALLKNREVIVMMLRFFRALREKSKHEGGYDDRELQRLLAKRKH